MANKRFLLGILVMVLVFGMTVVGCEDEELTDNFNGTLEFRIKNSTSYTIENIDFGRLVGNPLHTEILNLTPGETSSICKVSGYDNSSDNASLIFVYYTLDIKFSPSSSGPSFVGTTSSKKIDVNVEGTSSMSIHTSTGNW